MPLNYQHLYQGVTRLLASVKMLAHMLVHCQPACVYTDVCIVQCVCVQAEYILQQSVHASGITAVSVVLVVLPMPEHTGSCYQQVCLK
jgi:hypothetical protein